MVDPLTFAEAVERYRKARAPDVAPTTQANLEYRLNKFLDWVAESEYQDTGEITGRLVDDYVQDLHEELSAVTVKNHLTTVRDLVDYCERIEASPDGVARRVDIPTLALHEEVDDTVLEADRARSVIDYLERFEYASLRHVTVLLLWHTGMRRGSIHSLDVGDYSSEGRWLQLRHRPSEGTTLKNKRKGEREINLHPDVCDVLDDYLAQTRPDVTDAHGREPLLATASGRVEASTIQRQVYTATRPCHYTNECPVGREMETCEATAHNKASQCPDSVSPHAIRRGRITHELLEGKPKEYASARMNVSTEVLEDHYDARTQRETRMQRREFLDDV